MGSLISTSVSCPSNIYQASEVAGKNLKNIELANSLFCILCSHNLFLLGWCCTIFFLVVIFVDGKTNSIWTQSKSKWWPAIESCARKYCLFIFFNMTSYNRDYCEGTKLVCCIKIHCQGGGDDVFLDLQWTLREIIARTKNAPMLPGAAIASWSWVGLLWTGVCQDTRPPRGGGGWRREWCGVRWGIKGCKLCHCSLLPELLCQKKVSPEQR